MRKRIFRFCIALAIAFTCCIGCQAEVSAADAVGTETPADQFTYRYSSAYQGIELTKYKGKAAVVNIPAEIDGVPVTAIGEDCFKKKKKLAELTMPDSVASIGEEAFAYCTALEHIRWSEGLKSIGEYAFRECKIKSLYMPESLTFLGDSAFIECMSLEEVVCSDGLTELNGTFWHCRNLKWFRFPSSSQFTKIGDRTFMGCSLKKVEIPASVTEIGEDALKCGLEKITFPKDSRLEKIGSGAFSSGRYRKITLPASVKELGENVFSDSENLKKISFEKNAKVKKIPNHFFAYCIHLEEVDIPENVTEIGAFLFDDTHEGYVDIKKINIKGGKIKKMDGFKGLIKDGTITVPKKYKKKYTKMFQKQKWWYKKTMKIKAVKNI